MFTIAIEFDGGITVEYTNVAQEDVEFLAKMGSEIVWILA